MKVCLINLGCAKNVADGEYLAGLLSDEGFEFTPAPEEADVIFINTCGFLRDAEIESEEFIQFVRRAASARPGVKIIVGGCYPQKLAICGRENITGADLVLGVDEMFALPEILKKYRQTGHLEKGFRVSKQPAFIYEKAGMRAVSTSGWAFVKIADGCSNECTFCNIPVIKGLQRSRSIESIVEEVEVLAEMGVKEINLVSQDTNAYGRDRGEAQALLHLLQALEEVKGIEWIRLLYLYPRPFSDALLEFISSSRKVLPYFDIPVQHGDDRILRAMKRGLSREELIKLFEHIRTRVPGAVFRTSVIVGFPGEDARALKNLLSFIEEVRFLYLGVFLYSREPGSPAYSLSDSIPREEKEARMQAVLEVQRSITSRILASFKGSTLSFLSEEDRGDSSEGRVWFQAPEVDGRTFVKGDVTPGKMVKIVVEESFEYDVQGCIVGDSCSRRASARQRLR